MTVHHFHHSISFIGIHIFYAIFAKAVGLRRNHFYQPLRAALLGIPGSVDAVTFGGVRDVRRLDDVQRATSPLTKLPSTSAGGRAQTLFRHAARPIVGRSLAFVDAG